MKKLIIQENAAAQTSEISKINQFRDAVNKELHQFKADTGYSPTLEEVKSLMISRDTSGLQSSLNSSLERELDKMNITSKLMRDNHKAGANDFVNKLLNRFQQLSQEVRYLHNLSMKDGLLLLSKEQEEQVRDSFRNCITSETGKELYEKHKVLAQSFSEFSKFLKEKTSLRYVSSGELAREFFDMDYETGNIEISNIAYERIIQWRIARDKK